MFGFGFGLNLFKGFVHQFVGAKLLLIIMKKTTAKRARGSSSASFDAKRFVLVEAEARFHDSIKRGVGLKERGFEIDSPYMHFIEAIIER